MNNKILKLTVAMIAVILLTASLVVAVAAETYTGKCGTNVTYTLNTSTGVLEINGTGAMTDYSSSSDAPWYSYRSYVKTVKIGDSVLWIGEYAFSNCSSLTSVEIPDSVTSIGSSAFSGCSSLTSVEIGDSVTSIGNYAFYNCNSLTSVEIPDSVTSIGNYAFWGCSSLTSVEIPDGVTSIGVSAFNRCSSLTSVEIPDSVTKIDDYTFSGCSSLTSITFLTKDATINATAFSDCTALETIYCYPNSTADEYFANSGYNIYYLDALTFTVEATEAIIGKNVKVDVVISNNPGIAGFSFKVGYDSSAMSLVGYECPGWEASSSSFDENPSKNPVGFSWSRTKDYTANTTILTLEFRIKETAPEGEYNITLSTTDVVSNQAGEKLIFNLVEGKVSVVDCTPGDLNDDGDVNSIDAVLLAQHLANWDVQFNENAADCNGDGEINSIDAVLLAQFLAGWDVTLG